MRGFLARMIQGGAAIVALSLAPALAEDAEDSVTLSPASQPPSEVVLPVAKTKSLFKHATYQGAWRAAQKSNRPILVYVSMPNCHFCEKMKDQVYKLPQVKNLVSGSFETILVDRYAHAKLVEKLQVKWYPTTVLGWSEQQNHGRYRRICRTGPVSAATANRASLCRHHTFGGRKRGNS